MHINKQEKVTGAVTMHDFFAYYNVYRLVVVSYLQPLLYFVFNYYQLFLLDANKNNKLLLLNGACKLASNGA